MPGRRVALAVIALGIGMAAAAQLGAPLAGPPLYDGVVVVQPYVYVNPPAGKPGGAKGASAHVSMNGPKNAVVAVATPEQPPQAQVVAGDGTLILPSSATALDVSITPLDPTVGASAVGAAEVLGNVYRIAIVDQAGAAATALPSSLVTVVIRAPGDVAGAQVGQVINGAWYPLKSEPMFGSTYVAVVTSFGDFAVIVPGTSPAIPSGPGASPGTGTSTPGSAASPASAPEVSSGTVLGIVSAIVFVVLLAGTLMGLIVHRIRRR